MNTTLSNQKDNPNYRAKVIKINNLNKHPKADRLQICSVLGYSVITGLDAKIGDLYIYFPLECAINKEYLKFSNSFSDKELNTDKEKSGFFVHTGRVRAVSLRGVRSEGYIIPVSNINKWLGCNINEEHLNVDFDSINDILLCEKYVNYKKLAQEQIIANRQNKKVKRESRIVENQFRLHEDTEQIKRNIEKINPEDYISIGSKWHGTSAVISKVLCKRPLKFYEKILQKLGVKIDDKIYDLIYASRKVVKNCYADKEHDSFYDVDVWGIIANRYKDSLKDGITLYGEIVNQLPTGAWIQKDYDYSLEPKTCEFYVYRITYTSPSGDVFEFTKNQIERYCAKMGLKTVVYFYYGKAKDLFPELNIENHWHENFLAKLIEKYTEKKCVFCKNDVPEEGIVIIKEADFYEGFKLKSLNFLSRESAELDKGETNIEDEQAVDEDLSLKP